VLRPGGLFLASREHVADNEAQLQAFLASHPVHQRAGGENAYRLDEYLRAITGAGLALKGVIRPLDSVITAFPSVRAQHELDTWFMNSQRRRTRLLLRLGSLVPGLVSAYRHRRADTGAAGRLYAFVASKP
jgi:hypothetical protein